MDSPVVVKTEEIVARKIQEAEQINANSEKKEEKIVRTQEEIEAMYIAQKIKTFIDMILASKSGTLVVQSIYPTKHSYRINDIKYVNECIKEYCDVVGVEYLDMYSLLATEEDLFDERFTDDGIHPNVAGYELLANEVNKRLNKGIQIQLKRDTDTNNEC